MTLFYWCIRYLLRWAFWFGGGLEVIGRERVPPGGPVILASNHTSYLDPPVLGAALQRPISFMARKTLFDNPLFGAVIRRLNAFPLDREGGSRDALRTFESRLAENRAVVLFPEGTRSDNGRLQEFKGGVGLIATRSKAAVLPIYIWGTFQSWPRGQKRPRAHPIKVWIGDPIVPREAEDRAARKAEQERIVTELRQRLHQLEETALAHASVSGDRGAEDGALTERGEIHG